jgi:hypothetical protein
MANDDFDLDGILGQVDDSKKYFEEIFLDASRQSDDFDIDRILGQFD